MKVILYAVLVVAFMFVSPVYAQTSKFYQQIYGITQCNDGIDNDSDGAVDFASDPGCSSWADDDESDDPPIDDGGGDDGGDDGGGGGNDDGEDDSGSDDGEDDSTDDGNGSGDDSGSGDADGGLSDGDNTNATGGGGQGTDTSQGNATGSLNEFAETIQDVIQQQAPEFFYTIPQYYYKQLGNVLGISGNEQDDGLPIVSVTLADIIIKLFIGFVLAGFIFWRLLFVFFDDDDDDEQNKPTTTGQL